MTPLMVVVLKILLVLELLYGASGQNATNKSCISIAMSHGYINCSINPCHVTCHKGYFLFGPKTVNCTNGVPVNLRLSKCVGVRLLGGSVNGSSGQVQLELDGVRGSIANYYKYPNSPWSLREANVVCRMLGFPNASYAIGRSSFYPAASACLLQYVKCKGDELSISQCSHSGLERSWQLQCYYFAVGVVCGDPKISFRLTRFSETTSSAGRVEVSVGGVWSAVPYRGWTIEAGNVVCKMHGLPNATVILKPPMIPLGYIDWVRVKHCFGNESSLVDCSLEILESPGYSDNEAGVICGQPNVSLRMTGGLNEQEGNVEAYINGVMVFLVLNSTNEQNVSKVICRTLGLPPPIMTIRSNKLLYLQTLNYFILRREGFLQMYLSCTGNEQNILECKNKTILGYLHTGELHAVSCRKDYRCPTNCRCSSFNEYYLSKKYDYEARCVNSNLTKTLNTIPALARFLSLVNDGEKIEMEERHLLRLPYCLKTLEIKGYKIKRLKRRYFIKLEHLTELTLHQNDLNDIEPWSISKLQFSKIDIQHNNITRLRRHAFVGVCRCKEMILSNNSIEVLEPEVFGMPFSMIIEGNNISTIESRTFLSLSRTTVTEMRNRLSEFERSSLQDQMTMSLGCYLNLQRNRISTLKPSAIGGRTSFGRFYIDPETIILSDNLITNIAKTTLSDLSSIHTLFLNANPLEVIEEGAFRNNQNLRILNLIDTRLQQISPAILQLPKAISIYVYKSQSNPLFLACRTSSKFFYERGYKYHLSMGRCEACPPGTYKIGTRDGTCLQCPAGGFYQDEEAQYKILSHGLGCKQCPPGSFVTEEQAPGKDRAECQACPEGTHRNLPALFRACSCLDDHYRVHRFHKCMPCNDGYQCINESINLLTGFYWKWSSVDTKYLYTNFSAELQVRNKTYNKNLTSYSLGIPKAYACPVAEACKGGVDSECSLGYEGPLCAVCSKGFYMLASSCRKCPSLPWIIAQVVLITVIVAGLLIFMIKEKKSKSNQRSLSDAMTARLKIVIGFFQVTSGTISGFSYIKWPDVMISAIKYAELLQMNLLQIAPPQCLTRSLKTDIHVKLMLILAFNSTVVFMGLLYYFIKTRSKSRNGEENENIKSSTQQQCFRAVFLILFISYPLTSSHIFMVLPEACQKICPSAEENICNYYLKSDFNVRCDSQRFFWFSIFARVLLIYPVGFPLLVLYLLWKYYYQNADTKKRSKEVIGIALGLRFLYENYAEDVWFWEIIELVRKVLLTSVILLLDAGSRFSIGITAMMSGLYSISFAYFKPMTDVFEHWLQLTSLLATLVNMIVGILLVTQASGEALDGTVIKVLLMGANAAVVAIMAARYLTTLGQTFFAIRRNPHCSLSCCLFLFLTINEAGKEMAGVDTSSKGIKRQQNRQLNFGEPQLDLSQAGLSVKLENEN